MWQAFERDGKGSFRRERNARGFPSSLLPRAWSRALIPFPFPFERLPRRLEFYETCKKPINRVSNHILVFWTSLKICTLHLLGILINLIYTNGCICHYLYCVHYHLHENIPSRFIKGTKSAYEKSDIDC